MKPRLFQTSLDQTGVVFINFENSTKIFPLFSLDLTCEAEKLAGTIGKGNPSITVKRVFACNNILDYKIEDLIIDYQKTVNRFILPENYMEELVSGFPFVTGYNEETPVAIYK